MLKEEDKEVGSTKDDYQILLYVHLLHIIGLQYDYCSDCCSCLLVDQEQHQYTILHQEWTQVRKCAVDAYIQPIHLSLMVLHAGLPPLLQPAAATQQQHPHHSQQKVV